MKKNQAILLAVLVVLVGVAIYMWSGGESDVDPVLAETPLKYACPHCNNEFSLTGEEYSASFAANGGLVCPNCNKKIDDPTTAAKDLGYFTTEEDPQMPEEEKEFRKYKDSMRPPS